MCAFARYVRSLLPFTILSRRRLRELRQAEFELYTATVAVSTAPVAPTAPVTPPQDVPDTTSAQTGHKAPPAADQELDDFEFV